MATVISPYRRCMAHILGWTGVMFSFLCIFAGTALIRFETPTPDPISVVFDPQEFDFGNVPESVVAFRGRIVNRSQSPVDLKEVRVPCSCTSLRVKQGPIPAGGAVHFEGSIDLTGYNGVVNTAATALFDDLRDGLSTNTPIHPTLTFKCTVRPLYTVIPPSVEFSDDENEARLQLSIGEDPTVKIQSAVASHPAISAVVEGADSIRVMFDRSKWFESGPSSVQIRTSSGQRPVTAVPVRVTVK